MVEVSTVGFLHQEASLSVQPVVKVKHSRFYCYGSESGDIDKSICSSAYCVSVMIKNIDSKFIWRFISVYGSPYDEGKSEFIQELHSLLDN